ncbi:MAG TPA: hypothetical protein VL172_12615, partial [Kofleriaceae bacterium]|nr:hypothetical protein [Kofleriaceae bacterium]
YGAPAARRRRWPLLLAIALVLAGLGVGAFLIFGRSHGRGQPEAGELDLFGGGDGPGQPGNPDDEPRPADAKIHGIALDGALTIPKTLGRVTVVLPFDVGDADARALHRRLLRAVTALNGRGPDSAAIAYLLLPSPGRTRIAALALCAAHKSGHFAEMLDHIIDDQLGSSAHNIGDAAWLRGVADSVGIDEVTFKGSADSAACEMLLDVHAQVLAADSITRMTSPPTFFVNGRRYQQALLPRRIEELLDAAAATAETNAKAAGTPPDRYYAEWILPADQAAALGDEAICAAIEAIVGGPSLQLALPGPTCTAGLAKVAPATRICAHDATTIDALRGCGEPVRRMIGAANGPPEGATRHGEQSYVVLSPGSGATAAAGDVLKMHLLQRTTDGKDPVSIDRPQEVTAGTIWEDLFSGLGVGARVRIWFPHEGDVIVDDWQIEAITKPTPARPKRRGR